MSGENDGPHMPKPQNSDEAGEVATLCSKSIAALLDCQKAGKLPDDWEPSPESQLEASAIIDNYSQQQGLG